VIYCKSVLVGLLALVVSVIVLGSVLYVGLQAWIRLHGGSYLGGITLSLKSPLLWGVILLIFGAGFYWEYRRLST
jgi:hypothetical protein